MTSRFDWYLDRVVHFERSGTLTVYHDVVRATSDLDSDCFMRHLQGCRHLRSPFAVLTWAFATVSPYKSTLSHLIRPVSTKISAKRRILDYLINAKEKISRSAAGVGVRSIIVVAVERISESCGYGVPLMSFDQHRPTMDQWSRRKGPEGIRDYRAQNNRTSVDDLEGLDIP